MKVNTSHAVGAYAGIVTLGLAALVLGAATRPPQRFDTIDVKRINVREDDGRLRMIISGSDNIAGIIVGGKEYPHPDRTQAGMIFFNDEGSENGGLVFDGRLVNGKPTNGGQLSFDRWHQDQTLYIRSIEDGPKRAAGIYVHDRDDKPMDFAAGQRLHAMPDGPAKTAALKAAGFDQSMLRAFLGRDYDDESKLVLRDGAGRARLKLSVSKDGAASITFMDAAGQPVRTIDATQLAADAR